METPYCPFRVEESEPQGEPTAMREREVGKSECRSVRERIRVSRLPGTKVSPRLTGASLRENLENRYYGERQLTVAIVTGASPTQWEDWDSIDWTEVYHRVNRLQVRIAKAVKGKRWNKVTSLQYRLTRSYTARLWAVRRVVTNKGKNTPGIDGVVWVTEVQKLEAARDFCFRGYKPAPLRRIYIPKSNGKRRPLGIPTMTDRAMQALFALALDPVSEVLADINSYGFRRNRSLHDAVAQSFIVLARKTSPEWILEGDIKACFDKISHDWLLTNIPMEKKILQGWLKAGYMEDNAYFETEEGTPQGGIISPILCNMALDGLEQAARSAVSKSQSWKINVVRYADDFIITGASKELLEKEVKPTVVQFLATRGLILSEEKTHICHIDEGFDFLGVNIRKYSGKLLIKPAAGKVRGFRIKIREFIKNNLSAPLVPFLKQLNSMLRGWAQCYRGVVAKEIFSLIDAYLYRLLRRWTRLRHRSKTQAWCKKHYYHRWGERWVFGILYTNRKGNTSQLKLFHLSDLPIRRHIKVVAHANPYDPSWDLYYRDRRRRLFLNRKRDRYFLATPAIERMVC